MSMHDVEAVTEQAARLLDRTAYPDLRTLYSGLFDDFGTLPVIDVGFIAFRLREMLLKHGYAYRLATEAHPEYAALGTKADNWIYAFLGDDLWKQMVADGLLTGKDAAPPNLTLDAPLILTRLVLTEAEKDGDEDFMARWYPALLIWLQFSTDDHELLEVAANPLLGEIMEIVARNQASDPPEGFALSEYFSGALPLTPESFVHGSLQSRRDAE